MADSESMLNVPRYSATFIPGIPSCLPNRPTKGKKLVPATATAGIPAFSATMPGRTAAGVQVPHPPLPVITASQPLVSNAALTSSNVSAFFPDPNEEIVTVGNSVNGIILTVG